MAWWMHICVDCIRSGNIVRRQPGADRSVTKMEGNEKSAGDERERERARAHAPIPAHYQSKGGIYIKGGLSFSFDSRHLSRRRRFN